MRVRESDHHRRESVSNPRARVVGDGDESDQQTESPTEERRRTRSASRQGSRRREGRTNTWLKEQTRVRSLSFRETQVMAKQLMIQRTEDGMTSRFLWEGRKGWKMSLARRASGERSTRRVERTS